MKIELAFGIITQITAPAGAIIELSRRKPGPFDFNAEFLVGHYTTNYPVSSFSKLTLL